MIKQQVLLATKPLLQPYPSVFSSFTTSELDKKKEPNQLNKVQLAFSHHDHVNYSIYSLTDTFHCFIC